MRFLILLFFSLPCHAQDYISADSLVKLFKDPGAVQKLHKDSTNSNDSLKMEYYSDQKNSFIIHYYHDRRSVMEYRVKDREQYKKWFGQVLDMGFIDFASFVGERNEIYTEFVNEELQLVIMAEKGEYVMAVFHLQK
jgi:hypothetical protein